MKRPAGRIAESIDPAPRGKVKRSPSLRPEAPRPASARSARRSDLVWPPCDRPSKEGLRMEDDGIRISKRVERQLQPWLLRKLGDSEARPDGAACSPNVLPAAD